MALSMYIEGTEKVINPIILSDREKEEYYNKKTQFVCSCSRKNTLIYRLSSDHRLYPIHNEFSRLHAPFCQLSDRYDEKKYANALQRNDDGSLRANLKDNILKRPDRTIRDSDPYIIKKCPEEKGGIRQMRMSTLIKDINLETCYQQAQRLKNTGNGYKSAEDFSKEVYRKAENTPIENRGVNMAGDTLKPFGADFRYTRVTGITVIDFSEGKREEKTKTVIDEKYLAYLKKRIDAGKATYIRLNYTGTENKTVQRTITDKALYYGALQYLRTYNQTSIYLEDNTIMGAFYSYEDKYRLNDSAEKRRKLIDRLTLLLVNRYGIFCESTCEVEAYDFIMDYCQKNGGLYFYKPYRFTTNAYGGEYLEDGIIEVRHGRPIVLEVFGIKGSEEYDEKKRLKVKYASQNTDSYIFLEWMPDEGLEKLETKLKESIKMAKR